MVPKAAKSWEAIAMDHKWMIWNVRPTSGVPEWSPSVQFQHGYPRFVRFKLKFARNYFPKFKNMFIMFHNKSYRGMILLKDCQTFVFFSNLGFYYLNLPRFKAAFHPLSRHNGLGCFCPDAVERNHQLDERNHQCQGLNSQYLHI